LNQFEFFGDLQLRNIDYNTKIITQGDGEGADLDKNWTFFNPKAGVNFNIDNGKVFVSYANAHREPNRDDLLQTRKQKQKHCMILKRVGNSNSEKCLLRPMPIICITEISWF
jgi:outer membrane receptor for monomeric catechols